MKLAGFTYSNPTLLMNPKTTLSPSARYGLGDDSLGMAAEAATTSRHMTSRKVRRRRTMTASRSEKSQTARQSGDSGAWARKGGRPMREEFYLHCDGALNSERGFQFSLRKSRVTDVAIDFEVVSDGLRALYVPRVLIGNPGCDVGRLLAPKERLAAIEECRDLFPAGKKLERMEQR